MKQASGRFFRGINRLFRSLFDRGEDFQKIRKPKKYIFRRILSVGLIVFLIFGSWKALQSASVPVYASETNITAFVSKYIQQHYYYSKDGIDMDENKATLKMLEAEPFEKPVYDEGISMANVAASQIRVAQIVRNDTALAINLVVDVTLTPIDGDRYAIRQYIELYLYETPAHKFLVTSPPNYVDHSINLIASTDEQKAYLEVRKQEEGNGGKHITSEELKQSETLIKTFFEFYGVDNTKLGTLISGQVPKLPSGITFDPESVKVIDDEVIKTGVFDITVEVMLQKSGMKQKSYYIIRLNQNKVESIKERGAAE